LSPDWRDLLVFEGDDNTTYGEWVAGLRERASSQGQGAEVFSVLYHRVVGLHQAGLDTEALGLLEEMSGFLGPSNVPPEEWPWFFNGLGMAQGALGRHEEAEAAYTRMQELAEQVENEEARKNIVSTAQQNRGINALDAGDPERAITFLRDAGLAKRYLGDYVAAVDILNTLAMAVAGQGNLDEAERMLSDVIDLAELMQDPRRVAAAIGNRGALKAQRGDYEGAENDLRQTLAATRDERDRLREAQAMMGIGTSLVQRGELGQGLRWYRRAAELASEQGMVMLEAQLHRTVAVTLLRLGRAADAMPEMQRALELARQLEHPELVARALADLGALYVDLGEYEQAGRVLEDARAAFAHVDDPVWRSQVLRNLAERAVQTDGPAAADELWQEAIALLGDYPRTAAEIAHRAAEAWLFAGAADDGESDSGTSRERAEHWLRVELDHARSFEDASAVAWRTASAGALLNWRDRNEAGLLLLEEALAQYDSLDEPLPETQVRMDVAVALTDLGRHDEAVATFEECLQFATERSDRVTRQRALGNLGEVFRRRGELERAREVLEESEAFARALDDEEAIARSRASLGLVLFQSGALDEAEEHYRAAYEIARRLHAMSELASALGGLGSVELARGRPVRAAGYFRRAARLHSGLWSVGLVEDLGGLLNSLAAAGKENELQAVSQELVDVAQDAGLREKAAEGFELAARTLLGRGQRDEAASLYTASFRLRLGAVDAREGEAPPAEVETKDQQEGKLSQATMNAVIRSLGIVTAHVEVDLPEDEREPFYELVLGAFDRVHEGLGDDLRPWLQTVREGFEEQGVFDRLRDTENDA
jgi:tetratricopeptide (TPR) repeat protein